MDGLQELFGKSVQVGSGEITLLSFLLFCLILLVTFLLVSVIKKGLGRLFKTRNTDVGRQFATKRLVSYFFWFFGFVAAIQVLGLNLEGLVLGSAALLVGIGIGLQQIFNDLFSGLILLFEGNVEVGDVVDIDGMIGRVDKISLRTSDIRTLDNITVVLPNSRLISEKVVNWNSNNGVARFHIPVSVAYGSDVDKVTDILMKCALECDPVLNKPEPKVLFQSFGNSSLDFDLMFWSKEFRQIENTRSDLRYQINKVFNEEGIEIPYPQMDVHVKPDP